MPTDELDDEDDDLDDDEEQGYDDEEDEDDDEEDEVDHADLLDDIAESITQGVDYADEVDIADNRVTITTSDGARWELALTKVG